jgi:PAS domain S-box-containing protein
MPLSERNTGPDPGAVLAWQILAPIAGLFGVLLLLAGFAGSEFFRPLALERDLARAQRYADFAAVTVVRGMPSATPQELVDEFRRAGLEALEFVGPEKIPSWVSPRFVPSGPFVEAWSPANSATGARQGALMLRKQADSVVFVQRALRAFAIASCVTFALLVFLAWLLFKNRVADRASAMIRELGSSTEEGGTGTDAIDRIHAAWLASQSEADNEIRSLRQLLDGHTEMFCASSKDGTIIGVNEAYCRFFGKTREQLVGTNYLDLIPPADRGEALGSVQKLTPQAPANTTEHRVILPGGEVRWVRWHDSATFKRGAEPAEIHSFGADITAEKNLADRIDALGRAFDQMQSLAETGSLTWDFAAERMEWTPETRRLLGVDHSTPASIDGLLAVIAPDDRETMRRLFQEAREQGRNFQHEFHTALPDGSLRVLQGRTEVLADPKTKLLNNLTCTLRDITALRDAEAATKRELRFREAIEQSMGVGIVVRDLEGNTLSANHAFCVMTGFGEEELKAATPPDEPYWPVDERPRIVAALQQALSGDGPTGGFALVFCRKNGSRFDALVNVSTVLDSNGKPFAILGAVTDISAIQKTRRELAAAEKELRQELNYRETIEKSTTVGLVAIGVDGRPLSANDAYCRMLGYSEEEILAWSPPYPCWPEEEHVNIQHAFDLHLRGKTPTEGFQIRLRKKDGTLFDVVITVSPIMDAEGKQTGLLSALTDVTALQSARRESTASNERLRIAQDVIEFGIWDWDPAADTLFWDRNSFAMFGHPEATDPQEVWKAVHSEEDQERLTYELKRLVAAGGKSGQDRLHARWPEGSVHEILSTYVIIRDAQGKAVRVLGVNRDVTEELEEELEFRSAQERLAAALEGGSFGTFEHVFGVGALNWNAANYEIYEIDPGITDPDELFQAWKAVVGAEYAALEQKISGLPVTKNVITYIFSITVPKTGEKRRISSSVFVERNKKGHPLRLVGISRRLD